jgi:hypothetical protein
VSHMHARRKVRCKQSILPDGGLTVVRSSCATATNYEGKSLMAELLDYGNSVRQNRSPRPSGYAKPSRFEKEFGPGQVLTSDHRSQTHLSLDQDGPDTRPPQPPAMGNVIAIPQVGGLHHRYQRLAA